jgi:hypothetical protein
VCLAILVRTDLLKHWRATHKQDVFQNSCQWYKSAETLESDTQTGAFLVSGSDLLKQYRVTHKLDWCSAILISSSDLLKHWRETYILVACSAILINDLLKHWRATHMLMCVQHLVSDSQTLETTHILDPCSAILVSGSDLLKHLESSSHAGSMFSHSCQWF